MTQPISRRRAIAGVATVGLSLPLLSACGDDSGPTASDPAGTSDDPSTEPSSDSPSNDPSDDAPTPRAGAISTADVPVGGGLIVAADSVVVTQPTEGDFKVFSATCTHTGCQVGSVSSTINCPCHGSAFDLSTGEVLGGPASAPLPPVDFTVEGDRVVLS